MSTISPISGGPRPVSNEASDRSARGRDVAAAARGISEVTNGERNAAATAAEVRRVVQSAARQSGVGGALDLRG